MANHLAVTTGLPLALIIAHRIWTLVYNIWLSPLKHFPGPLSWRVTQIPCYRSRVCGSSHRDILRLHETYIPIVRIGPNMLSYADERVWADVWAHRQGHAEFSKADVLVPVNGVKGILGADREAHSRYRRLFSHAFSAQGLQEQEPRVKEYVDLLMDGLSSHGQKGPVDVVSWFNWTTFDLIGDLAFGDSFGCLENARTHPWIAGVYGNIANGVFAAAVRAFGPSRLLALLVPKRLIKLRLENYRYTSEKISQRIHMGSARGDFFDKVLEKPEEDGGMTIKELESNASSIVLAGSETTATMLSGTVFHLLSNPLILEKLTRELRTAFKSEDEITIRSSSEQKYLLAVLSESMRLYPPVPAFSGRFVPPPGDTVAGEYLPGGTVIQFNHVAAYRMESNFARPNEFLPQRWIGDAEFESDNTPAFQPFSVGPRNCIGRNLAYAEMRLITARLLWRFDLAIAEGSSNWRRWIEDQKTFILWDKPPLRVSIQDRLLT